MSAFSIAVSVAAEAATETAQPNGNIQLFTKIHFNIRVSCSISAQPFLIVFLSFVSLQLFSSIYLFGLKLKLPFLYSVESVSSFCIRNFILSIFLIAVTSAALNECVCVCYYLEEIKLSSVFDNV